MSVPLSMKLPPMLKDVSSSVTGRRQCTIYPATGSIDYSASNRLITFNISSENSLLDTDKLYLEFVALFDKPANVAIVPNQSAESFIDRIVLRVGSKVIVDTSYGYNLAETMLHHWQPADFSASSGNIMGISSLDLSRPLSDFNSPANDGVIVATNAIHQGNCTWASRCKRYGYDKATNTIRSLTAGAIALSGAGPYVSCKHIVPIRLCGFLDQITNLIPLFVLDSTIALSLDIYLAANAQVAASFVNTAAAGTFFDDTVATAAANAAPYVIRDVVLSADYVDVTDDYRNTINSYLSNGGVLSIPSSEFNIYQFTVPTTGNEASFQLSAVYKNLEAIYISFFQNINAIGANSTDQLVFPANLTSVQLQCGSKYFPSDQPLDVTGRATRAFQQTAKAFSPHGMESGFSFPADAYASAGVDYLSIAANCVRLIATETQTYFVVGFPFDSVLDEDDSTLVGLDTSVGSGIITIRLRGSGAIGGGTATQMVVLCKYKQSVNVSSNYLVDRMF